MFNLFSYSNFYYSCFSITRNTYHISCCMSRYRCSEVPSWINISSHTQDIKLLSHMHQSSCFSSRSKRQDMPFSLSKLYSILLLVSCKRLTIVLRYAQRIFNSYYPLTCREISYLHSVSRSIIKNITKIIRNRNIFFHESINLVVWSICFSDIHGIYLKSCRQMMGTQSSL